jgi:hypothetical protein
MTPRIAGLSKIVVAFVCFAAFGSIVWLLRQQGIDPGRLGAASALFVALAWAGLIELIAGRTFSQVASSWKSLPWWKQWPYLLLLVFAFLGLWVLFAAALP